MQMHKKLLAAASVAAMAALGLAGTAHASVGGHSVGIPLTAGSQSIAGWYATSNNAAVFPTHVSATLGSDGQNTLSNLTPWTGETGQITAAEGIGLVNSNTGTAAEIGIVNIGNGLMDVVADSGTLSTSGPTATHTSFGWVGLVNGTPQILLSHLPVNDSVDVDLLLPTGYSNGPVTAVTASAREAHFGNWHRTDLTLSDTPVVLDEVQAGVINGSQPSAALTASPSQVPLPNTSRFYMPGELGRIAHVDVSANVLNGREFFGARSTGGRPLASSTAFTGFPVYTFTAVTAGEQLDLAPTGWAQDNFAVMGGLPIGG